MTASLARSTQCRSSMRSTVGRPRAAFSTTAQLASEMARPRSCGSSASQCGSDIGRSSTASTAVRKVWGRPAFGSRSAVAPLNIESSRLFSAANGELCRFGLHSASISCQPSS